MFITADLRSLNQQFGESYANSAKALSLANGLRQAERAIHKYAVDPSRANLKAYCSALKAADEDAASGITSREFTRTDLSALRLKLSSHIAGCFAARANGSSSYAGREFLAFYNTASELRSKLGESSRAELENTGVLSSEAKDRTVEMLFARSGIATIILLLMLWVVYSLRSFNREIKEQREEILILKNGIEQSPLGVVLTNASGSIKYVNPAFTAMHGYEPAEVIGKDPSMLNAVEMPAADHQGLWKTLRGGSSWTGEFCDKTKTGALIWIKSDIFPIRDSSGQYANFMALHRDITYEKQLMGEVVEARREAERANQAKSDFLAAMSHEIRTPLNAIIGMSDVIDETGMSREQCRYLATIRNASDTLLSLINDVLDISKIEAGRMEVEKVPFNLEELVLKISEMIAVKAFTKNVEITCKIESDVPVFVEGDATRLGQVLTNIMGNAVKFVEKGRVSLNVKKQQLDGDRLQLMFSVRDTGIGIPADRHDSIFEKFTQAHTSTTRKYGGTGLGLPISRTLVEMMGGRIWLESEPGAGTAFYFTVSLRAQVNRPAVYLPKADVKELKGRRFLVVDDNPENRTIVSEIVRSWGASCEGAADGVKGLDKVLKAQRQGAPFHGVFVDLDMPGMSGYDFCRCLMADPSIAPKPVLALAISNTVIFNREDFSALGVHSYLVKPVKKQIMLDCALGMLSAEPAAVSAVPWKAAGHTKDALPALKLLVADDSQDNRFLISSFLKESKVELDLAVDGLSAIEKFKTGIYDIVFLDIQMPEMDGFEAVAKLRGLEAANKCARTRIVAFTAMATREDVDKALSAGFDDYLSKPIRKNTFYSYLVDFAANRSGPRRIKSLEVEA